MPGHAVERRAHAGGSEEGRTMAIAFHRREDHAGTHHRLWLVITGVIVFLLAALWTQPIH
jgi:hypothetical protein